MHSDLIAKLEALDGPSREVDAEIVFDAFATPVGKHKYDDGPIGYIDMADQPSWNLGLRFPGKDRDWFFSCRKQIKGETLLIERDGSYVLMNSLRVPELTSSLDSAVALVERLLPGWQFGIEWRREANGGVTAWCAANDDASRVRGASPAIALLIATLKALNVED